MCGQPQRSGLTQVLGLGKSFPVLWASVVPSRSAFLASCWIAAGLWLARCASRFGRIASDSAGAPPPSAWVDLRVGARVSSHRAVLAVAPSPVGVLASAGRRVRFGLTSLGLRVAGISASGSRVMRGVAACGSCASAVTSALTIRPSRRRFAARLNSGVRPHEDSRRNFIALPHRLRHYFSRAICLSRTRSRARQSRASCSREIRRDYGRVR